MHIADERPHLLKQRTRFIRRFASRPRNVLEIKLEVCARTCPVLFTNTGLRCASL